VNQVEQLFTDALRAVSLLCQDIADDTYVIPEDHSTAEELYKQAGAAVDPPSTITDFGAGPSGMAAIRPVIRPAVKTVVVEYDRRAAVRPKTPQYGFEPLHEVIGEDLVLEDSVPCDDRLEDFLEMPSPARHARELWRVAELLRREHEEKF
jgi:hypothetical protein